MTDPSLLEARQVKIGAGAPPINMQVWAGEIVGLIGLEGQGQDVFLETLCGVHKPQSGEVVAHTGTTSQPKQIQSLHDAVNANIAYLPRNRKSQGIFPALSVYDNFALASATKLSQSGIINRRRHRQQFQKYQDRLTIKLGRTSDTITTLSGGNQQKVLLARWLATNPRIMLLNDPTRGVDLRTRLIIYDVFREIVAEEQTTLVILSTEVEELLNLCDRILVFRDQHIFCELKHDQMTMSTIIANMFGNVAQ